MTAYLPSSPGKYIYYLVFNPTARMEQGNKITEYTVK